MKGFRLLNASGLAFPGMAAAGDGKSWQADDCLPCAREAAVVPVVSIVSIVPSPVRTLCRPAPDYSPRYFSSDYTSPGMIYVVLYIQIYMVQVI